MGLFSETGLHYTSIIKVVLESLAYERYVKLFSEKTSKYITKISTNFMGGKD